MKYGYELKEEIRILALKCKTKFEFRIKYNEEYLTSI